MWAQLNNLSDDTVMAHLARGHGDAIAVLVEQTILDGCAAGKTERRSV